MPPVDKQIAGATLDVFGARGAALSPPNAISSLGYLPRSLIYLPDGQLRYRSAFTYVVQFTGTNILVHAKTATLPLQIDSSSDFVVVTKSITATADLMTFTALANMPFTIIVQDTGANNTLQQAQMQVQNWFGEAGSPRVNLGVPYIFRRNSAVNVTLTNNHNATDFNVEVAFEGFKIFDYAAK